MKWVVIRCSGKAVYLSVLRRAMQHSSSCKLRVNSAEAESRLVHITTNEFFIHWKPTCVGLSVMDNWEFYTKFLVCFSTSCAIDWNLHGSCYLVKVKRTISLALSPRLVCVPILILLMYKQIKYSQLHLVVGIRNCCSAFLQHPREQVK